MTKRFHLHLVSDSTGETIQAAAKACLAQFVDAEPVEHFWNLVRTERQLGFVIEEIQAHPGVVLFTLLDPALRKKLEEACKRANAPAVPLLDPIFQALAGHLGLESVQVPGRQHALDKAYFDRIEALDFAMAHDDGQMAWELAEADIILVGPSRTSKTPTCIYLANRGYKTANIPLVPGAEPPEELGLVDRPLVVGLVKDVDSLVGIRRSRLKTLNQHDETTYVDPETVRQEVAMARRLYAKHGWPVIDVSRRSIEETSAEIIRLLHKRRGSA